MPSRAEAGQHQPEPRSPLFPAHPSIFLPPWRSADLCTPPTRFTTVAAVEKFDLGARERRVRLNLSPAEPKRAKPSPCPTWASLTDSRLKPRQAQGAALEESSEAGLGRNQGWAEPGRPQSLPHHSIFLPPWRSKEKSCKQTAPPHLAKFRWHCSATWEDKKHRGGREGAGWMAGWLGGRLGRLAGGSRRNGWVVVD